MGGNVAVFMQESSAWSRVVAPDTARLCSSMLILLAPRHRWCTLQGTHDISQLAQELQVFYLHWMSLVVDIIR